jgi:hypothetical protein
MTAMQMLRAICVCALALGLTGGLAACGKKASPRPPEGQESEYTYPRAYPDPKTVVPDADGESGAAPAHAGDLSPFPTSRTKTTYGSPISQ